MIRAVLLATALVILGCDIGAREALPRRCPARALPHRTAAQLAQLVTAGDSLTDAELSDLQVETAGLPFGAGCRVGVTVSFGNQLGGGVVILRDGGMFERDDVLYAERFPGAREPLEAGDRRFGFTHSAERGAGHALSRVTVLCALDESSWVVCAEASLNLEAVGVGTAPSSGRLASLSVSGHAQVDGDTLKIAAVSRWTDGSDSTSRDSTVSRLLLPRRMGRPIP